MSNILDGGKCHVIIGRIDARFPAIEIQNIKIGEKKDAAGVGDKEIEMYAMLNILKCFRSEINRFRFKGAVDRTERNTEDWRTNISP